MRFYYFIFLFAISYLNAAPIPGESPVFTIDSADFQIMVYTIQVD